MAANLELTVSQLNEYVRRMFQMDPMLRAIELKGEISNLKFHQSGALFFTMKDENASISCVMYSGDVDGLQACRLKAGAPWPAEAWRFTCGADNASSSSSGCARKVSACSMSGCKCLKKSWDARDCLNRNESGLWPPYPDTIGVVSSPTGAVIHDILNVSLRRNPDAHILLCPVRVQGIGADEEVVEAIHLLERLEHVSVIIVARGGGSMEDLWTFNEERVVRAVAMCKKPIVSAVGHETDVTLCDLAADLRAPTPSAAAECVVPVRDEMLNKIEIMHRQMQEIARNAVAERQNALKLAQIKLSANHPSLTIRRQEERLAQRMDALLRAAERQIQNRQTRLETRRQHLNCSAHMPRSKRGYAIVQNAGRAISKAGGLCVGDEVTVRFADGVIHAEVLSKEESHGEETDV